MTTANLLRTLLINCFPRCDITYFRVAQPFLCAHVYPFASGLSILVASLLV